MKQFMGYTVTPAGQVYNPQGKRLEYTNVEGWIPRGIHSR
jgi:hypothetical protein